MYAMKRYTNTLFLFLFLLSFLFGHQLLTHTQSFRSSLSMSSVFSFFLSFCCFWSCKKLKRERERRLQVGGGAIRIVRWESAEIERYGTETLYYFLSFCFFHLFTAKTWRRFLRESKSICGSFDLRGHS
jgi:hypothetical protein